LIHGGLRYLEHGELSLVRESLREREILFRIAPHLVRPLPILIPIYARAKRGALKIRAGMIAYDLLSFDKSLAHHQMLSREETLKRAPGLNSEGLRGAALYYDAQVEFPERLVLENALSAREHGAEFLTYARVQRMVPEKDAVQFVEFTDLLAGGVYTARARVVVNVSGPWVDDVLRQNDGSGRAPRERLIGGTKGSHIIVEDFAGEPRQRDALYTEAREDGRPFFIIKWNGKYLIGTTDMRFEGNLDRIEADEEEINYLIRETNAVLPSAQLNRESVLFTYSGVRPLPFVNNGSATSITRRHFVHDHAPELPGLISIVGGKLTTYRHLAEQTVNLLFKKLSRSAPVCATARQALPGAATENFKTFSERFKMKSTLPETVCERLLKVYGTRAFEVEKIANEDAELKKLFSREVYAIGAEVVMSFRHEMAETLIDCLWRRTMVGLSSAHLGMDEDDEAARVAQKFLGWSDERIAHEVAAYRQYVKRFHPRASSF